MPCIHSNNVIVVNKHINFSRYRNDNDTLTRVVYGMRVIYLATPPCVISVIAQIVTKRDNIIVSNLS